MRAVIISDRNELDALCRAWLGYDSATVERLQRENELLVAVLDTMRAIANDQDTPGYSGDSKWESLKAVAQDALAAYERAGEGE